MRDATGWESWDEEPLESERLRIETEIRSYPAPTPACDVYFNGLLESRSAISERLSALRAKQAIC